MFSVLSPWTVWASLVVLGVLAAYLLARRSTKLETPALTKIDLLDSGEEIEILGARIHYLQAGRGPDIILLHGIGASLFIWRFLIPRLALHYRVTAFDLPGSGASSKEIDRDYGLDSQCNLTLEFLNRLNIREATLIGSSMGGAIALWLAKLNANRFPQVIALAPATDPKRVPKLTPFLLPYMAPLSPHLSRVLNRPAMRLILRRVIGRKDLITDDVVDRYLKPYRDQGQAVRAFWSSLKLLSDPRLPEGLRGLKSRTLILYGVRDHLVTRRSVEKLSEVLPSAKIIIHANAGHHMMESDEEWTFEEIVKFLGA